MITGNYKTFAFASSDQFTSQANLVKNASNVGKDLRYYKSFVYDDVQLHVYGHTPMEVFTLIADVKLALDCGDCLEDNSDYLVAVINNSSAVDYTARIYGTGAQAH